MKNNKLVDFVGKQIRVGDTVVVVKGKTFLQGQVKAIGDDDPFLSFLNVNITVYFRDTGKEKVYKDLNKVIVVNKVFGGQN